MSYNNAYVDENYRRSMMEYEATDAQYDDKNWWWVWCRNGKGKWVNFGCKKQKEDAETLGRAKAEKVGVFAGEYHVLPVKTTNVSVAQQHLKRWLSDNANYDIDDATSTMIRKPAEEAKKKEDSADFWRF